MSDFYAEIAAEFRRMADDLEIAGAGMAKPWLTVEIQPPGDTDDEVIAAVDAVAGALLGEPGQAVRMASGAYHHTADGYRGPVRVAVYNEISRSGLT